MVLKTFATHGLASDVRHVWTFCMVSLLLGGHQQLPDRRMNAPTRTHASKYKTAAATRRAERASGPRGAGAFSSSCAVKVGISVSPLAPRGEGVVRLSTGVDVVRAA